MNHGRKLVVILFDLARQVLAQKELLDASNLLTLFERGLDSIQFTEVR